MLDGSNSRKKKRLTLIASLEGLRKAEQSLLSLGFESKSNFAESQLLSRSSVSNFFTRKPIQLDTFKRICEKLELKWQSIQGITEENTSKDLKEKQTNLSSYTEVGVEKMTTLVSEKTVLDEPSPITQAEIKVRGDIDSIQSIQSFVSDLKAKGGNTIEIVDIQEGSIKLIVEGSQEDINRLLLKIELGELTQIDGFPIESTQVLSEDSEYDASSKEKWRLVEEIVNNPTIGRNLGNVDLSDADLSGANLIDADLRGADLSDTDLRGADLRGANLSDTDLRGTDLRGADLRGANSSNANLRDLIVNYYLVVNYLRGFINTISMAVTVILLFALKRDDTAFRRELIRIMDRYIGDTDGGTHRYADGDVYMRDRRRYSNSGITERELIMLDTLKRELIKKGAIVDNFPSNRSSTFPKHMKY